MTGSIYTMKGYFCFLNIFKAGQVVCVIRIYNYLHFITLSLTNIIIGTGVSWEATTWWA